MTEQQQPHDNAPSGTPSEPEWTQVSSEQVVAARTHTPKAFAISAMAIGLISLLSAVVFGLYTPEIAGYVVIAGVLAMVLGAAALIKKHVPAAAGITGLITGALAVAIAILGASYGLTAFVSLDKDAQVDPVLEEAIEEGALIEWPNNMATGGLIFTEGLKLVRSDAQASSSGPAPAAADRSDEIADIILYVDYRCPVCNVFETANADTLEAVVGSGSATLEIVPLSFLDRVGTDYYSSRAAGAMACVASEQPEAAWNAHAALLSSEVQPTQQTAGLTNAELALALDTAVGGLHNAAYECIQDEAFVPFAQALNSWVFSTPVPNATDNALAVQGTPFAVVNGVPYEGAPNDAAAFAAFLEEQGL